MKNHSFLFPSPSPLHRWGVFGHDSRLHGGSIFGALEERGREGRRRITKTPSPPSLPQDGKSPKAEGKPNGKRNPWA